MSEFGGGYRPPESREPAPLNNENRFERVEQDKSPEVKKDTKYEPPQAPSAPVATDQNQVEPAKDAGEQRVQPSSLGKTGMASMQGDAPTDVPTPPASPPTDHS